MKAATSTARKTRDLGTASAPSAGNAGSRSRQVLDWGDFLWVGQDVLQLAAPARGIGAGAVAMGSCPIQNQLDAPAYP